MTQYSSYQKAIFDAVLNTEDNIVVQATAGSGKTTTIVEAANRLTNSADHQSSSILFVAFSKAIQLELEKRLPSSITTKTLHALGYKFIAKYLGRQPKMSDYKYSDLIKEIFKNDYKFEQEGNGDFYEVLFKTLTVIEFAQSQLVKPGDTEGLMNVLEMFEIDLVEDYEEMIIDSTFKALKAGREIFQKKGIISFSDMIWLPWALNMKIDGFDIVIGDEIQDLNLGQINLIQRVLRPGGRFIGVGDRSQMIFGFTGANINSMGILKDSFKAVELPLSICYRCPSSHIELAKQVDPTIEPAPGAKVGLIKQIREEDLAGLVKKGDMILSRTNAPLISTCYGLIRKGIPCHIKGSDIGKNLAAKAEKMFDKVNKLTAQNVYAMTEAYLTKEIAKLEAKFSKSADRLATAVAHLNDTVEVIQIIFESSEPKTVKELSANIKKLFSDQEGAITLSSIHRAKGLESTGVFLINPEKLPLPMTPGTVAYQSEMCVEFVALTRSQSDLYFIGNYHRFAGGEEA